MARRITKEQTYSATNIVTTSLSEAIEVSRAKTLSVQAVADVNTPAAVVFAPAAVNATDNTITSAAHGYTTGLKGQFTTVTTLPAGLSLLTDYFLIVIDANTLKVAATLADAVAGTPVIDITTQGTGNHTFTPTALAGGSISLLKSNDGTNYDLIGSATSITVDAHIWLNVVDPEYKYLKISQTLTAGRMSIDSYVIIKEDL